MNVIFNDTEFDRVVHGSLPDCGEEHFSIVVKDNATKSGAPAACMTFVAMTDSGPQRVQMVVTVRNLLQAAVALAGRYEYLTDRKWAPADTPEHLSGHIDGVGWNAVFMERVYLVSTEAEKGISIATTKEDAVTMANALIQAKGDRK